MTRVVKKSVRAAARSGRPVKPPKAPTAADAAGLRDRILDEVARLLMAAGFSSQDCATTFAACAARHAKSGTPASTVPTPGIIDSGHVLTHWYTSPDYLDADGAPRPLPLRGRGPSFCRLVAATTPEFEPEAVLSFLLSTNTVVRQGKHLVPRTRKVMLDTGGAQFAVQSLETVDALLGTILRNQATPDIADRFLEGTVTNHHFPASVVDALRKRVGHRSQEVMQDLDNEMARIERRAKPGERRVRVGLGMFLFETPTPRKRSR